jgi:hypothetical protein
MSDEKEYLLRPSQSLLTTHYSLLITHNSLLNFVNNNALQSIQGVVGCRNWLAILALAWLRCRCGGSASRKFRDFPNHAVADDQVIFGALEVVWSRQGELVVRE